MVIQSLLTSALGSPILSFVSIFSIIITILITRLFYTKDSRFHSLKKVIPGPTKLPLLGNTLDFLGPQEEILYKFSNWIKQYGPRVLYRVGSYWILSLAGAKDLEKLLSSTTETHKSVDYDQFVPWLGEGLLISNGKKWSHRRKLLTSAFHFKILEQFISVFNDQSMLLVNILKDEFPNGEQFDVSSYFTRCTLEIICETAMGVKINAQMDRNTPYIKAIHRMKELQVHRSMRPWLESSLAWDLFSYGREEKQLIKILHSFTEKVVSERKVQFIKQLNDVKTNETGNGNEYELPKKSEKRRLALLDLMFEAQQNGENFSDEGIREETDTFMFGGHDTTATAATFTLFLVGNNPAVQDKLHQELDEVFGNDQHRAVTAEDIPKLKYLECCIKESMRLCAPVPMVARTLQNDFELEKGLILPKETLVMIFPFQLHRDPKVFPEPEEYRPERFFPENCIGRHPFAYLPFSAGPRNCIGQKFAMMEEKVILANIFRSLKVESVQKLQDLALIADITLHSKSGIYIKITPR